MIKALTKLIIAATAVLMPAYAGAQSMTIHVKNGDPVKLQTNQIESITYTDDLAEEQTAAPKVGDYYYSDGTWSSDLDYSKSPIGVVFYTGDPTAEDPVLKADFPNCNHGLVVAASAAETGCIWQKDFLTFGSSVGDWVMNNLTGYTSTESNYGQDVIRNSILGYNNTKAIRAFNAANPEYAVVPVEMTADFEAKHAAPANSSGWYVPSVKELFILINGEPDNEEILLASTTHNNITTIDNSLVNLEGAMMIYNPMWAYNIWASTEFGGYTYTVCTYDGKVEGSIKDNHENFLPRFVLAF